jgi:hypothetical protein
LQLELENQSFLEVSLVYNKKKITFAMEIESTFLVDGQLSSGQNEVFEKCEIL